MLRFLFRQRPPRPRRPALRVVIDNKPTAPGTDLGAVFCANDIFEMAQLHPHLKTAGKPAKAATFLIGRSGALYRITVEAVR